MFLFWLTCLSNDRISTSLQLQPRRLSRNLTADDMHGSMFVSDLPPPQKVQHCVRCVRCTIGCKDQALWDVFGAHETRYHRPPNWHLIRWQFSLVGWYLYQSLGAPGSMSVAEMKRQKCLQISSQSWVLPGRGACAAWYVIWLAHGVI